MTAPTTGRVAHLVRHPIKSAGFEQIEMAALTESAAFPFDRVWAVAHAAARLPEPARLVTMPGQALTDQDQPLVSINGTASLADLSARMGCALSMHRFRGNIWVTDWAPWAELDLIGREITMGTARLRVEERIGRCRATGANPDTGLQDADTMAALETHYGHSDFGVFARVMHGGIVTLGDEVRI